MNSPSLRRSSSGRKEARTPSATEAATPSKLKIPCRSTLLYIPYVLCVGVCGCVGVCVCADRGRDRRLGIRAMEARERMPNKRDDQGSHAGGAGDPSARGWRLRQRGAPNQGFPALEERGT